MKTIIAIGGDEIGELQKDGTVKPVATESVHQEIIARTGKVNPRALYIPTAKDDSESYIAAFQRYYKKLGCGEVDVLRLIREKPTKKEIESKILTADIIYVNGGNTFRMMEIWKEHGIDNLLRKAYKKGAVMAGHSAGAICWFDYGDSDSFGKNKAYRVTALGIKNAVLCPHYDTQPFRGTGLKTIMKRTPDHVALALDECAAIEILDDKYKILAANPEAKARRCYWDKGEYIVEDIVPEEFGNLSSLLAKPA